MQAAADFSATLVDTAMVLQMVGDLEEVRGLHWPQFVLDLLSRSRMQQTLTCLQQWHELLVLPLTQSDREVDIRTLTPWHAGWYPSSLREQICGRRQTPAMQWFQPCALDATDLSLHIVEQPRLHLQRSSCWSWVASWSNASGQIRIQL